MQVCYNLYTFCDHAILTVYNNTIAKINKAIFAQLYSFLSIFYFTDFIEQNGGEENNIELPLVELLQIFNFSSLFLLKLSLKVGASIILLQNLSPKEGLCNNTYIVITCIRQHCIEIQILGGRFNSQVQLILYIKLTSIEGELPFIISKRQFPIQLCFAMTVNKLQGQSFNFIRVDLCMPVFIHRKLYVALLRVIDINELSVLLLQNRDSIIANIIYLEVLLDSQYI